MFWVYYEEVENLDMDMEVIRKEVIKTHKKVLLKVLTVDEAERF